LKEGDISHFHRIKSDETWHFYAGEELEIYEIDEEGNLIVTKLNGLSPQYTVKANRWFGSKPGKDSSFSFVGCTVSPGFDFIDFEIAKKSDLLKEFPLISDTINLMSLD
jgi:predicted cupin superfamily sugar epimerase